MLVNVLNALAAPGAASEGYGEAARGLTSDERREAVTLHLAAILESLPRDSAGERLEFPGLSLALEETDEEGDIAYGDIGIGYRVDGAQLARNDGPSTMSGLLELLVYARERSDSLLYVPQAMREDRIAALARGVGASERFVLFLMSKAPAIERNIAA